LGKRERFSLKSLKEVTDTLNKYFDRISEELVRKMFLEWA
jgi:hypothetical protein